MPRSQSCSRRSASRRGGEELQREASASAAASCRATNGRPARRRGDSPLRLEVLDRARPRDSGRSCQRRRLEQLLRRQASPRCSRLGGPAPTQLRRGIGARDPEAFAHATRARRVRHRGPRLHPVSVPRDLVRRSGSRLARAVRTLDSCDARRGHRCEGFAAARPRARPGGPRPRPRLARDARAHRVPRPGRPLLRAPRVRGQHAAGRGGTRLARRLAARVPRCSLALRRPGRSVTLARPGTRTKGARCRRT